MRILRSVLLLVVIQFFVLNEIADGWRRRRRRRRRCSPRNCVMSAWSSWSPCTATCGSSGEKTRTRSVQIPPACGGSSCGSTSCRNTTLPRNVLSDCVLVFLDIVEFVFCYMPIRDTEKESFYLEGTDLWRNTLPCKSADSALWQWKVFCL
jgi:hypothetical protein